GAAYALAAYALTAFGVSLTGKYPVPLAGMAFSPVLGLWLGAGLLAAQRRLSTCTPAASAS
ncbi:MAG: hypothetical protein U1C74_34155, partial [Phenylobacterium sp.]|nr:hypothetical protein [Phenylobacterium sp.]